ncbi:MAG: phosphate ABC transporter permease subunit PstC [Cyanobacteria bacterium J06627_8]
MLRSHTKSDPTIALLFLRERIIHGMFGICMSVPIIAVGIMFVVFVFHATLFFQDVSLWHFLSDSQWTPRFSVPSFGIGVLVSATFMITAIALIVAIPLGTFAAIYLSEYAPTFLRRILKPVLEALAGVPTIVYGYFALQFVTPQLRHIFPTISGFNSLSAGLVTGALIIPIISSISEDAIRDVPKDLREAAYAAGFTQLETIRHVVIPSALPGMIASYSLAASRSLGETMIASIAAGQYPNLSFNPLDAVESLTTFIVQVSLGDVPTDTLIFSTVFTVGLVLFFITLSLNHMGQVMVRRYTSKIAGLFVPVTESAPTAKPEKNLSQSMANQSMADLEGNQLFWSDGTLTSAITVSPSKTTPAPIALANANRLNAENNHPKSDYFCLNHTQRARAEQIMKIVGLLAACVGLIVFTLLLFGTFQEGLSRLNWQFITGPSSRTPEIAGISQALLGSIWLLILPSFLIIPIGIGAAVYSEEYLSPGRLRRFLDLHIANAAAIPSILYGIIGLAIFVRRLEPLTGGRSLMSASFVMAIIALPILIISVKTSLRTVPQDLRQASYAVGMTRSQVIWTIVLPEASPSIVTGVLLALSRIVGETAAILSIGAAAFVSFSPSLSLNGLQGGFTTIPTQIYFWALRPREEFQANAAASVIVLGALVLGMNVVAVLLKDIYRRRY